MKISTLEKARVLVVLLQMVLMTWDICVKLAQGRNCDHPVVQTSGSG